MANYLRHLRQMLMYLNVSSVGRKGMQSAKMYLKKNYISQISIAIK